ncbi:MAG: GGDEF domain-containing protein [Chloroflexi bacterium]|nr:GGDEF domain-containing protein [Chloroflexota bacterium]
MLGGRAAVYLDTGGDEPVRADLEAGDEAREGPATLPKRGTATERALRSGRPIEVGSSAQLPEASRQMKVAASTDGLRGIHNHRYFWDRLEEEIPRAERRGGNVSVAHFDIDGLKAVNDRHGHLAGDAVLPTLGQLIGGHVRHEDVPARYGGDEFAIFMPDTPHDEAEKAVGRLMELIERARVQLDGGDSIPMPARSWGVATHPADGRTVKGLVDRADSRAYAHKRR